MTPQAQRIAIAEACGYAGCPRQWVYDCWETGCAAGVIEGTGRWEKDTSKLPDYLNDLNAMHEAENALSPVLRSIYCDTLRFGRVRTVEDDPTIHGAVWQSINATAAQRAEAFLRTLNLWDDSK